MRKLKILARGYIPGIELTISKFPGRRNDGWKGYSGANIRIKNAEISLQRSGRSNARMNQNASKVADGRTYIHAVTTYHQRRHLFMHLSKDCAGRPSLSGRLGP